MTKSLINNLIFALLILFHTACSNVEQASQEAKMKLVAETAVAQKQVKAALNAADSMTVDSLKVMTDTKYSTDYLMGKFEPNKHPDFILIDKKYASRTGMYLRQDAYESFCKMHAAAKAAGIKLVIKSATRNFHAQKSIWEGKWTGGRLLEGGINASTTYPDPQKRALKILEWSSMPGTSRHHWGTDIDLNAFVNSYFEKGQGLKEYQWLQANAATYGFCQPYSPKGAARPHGYNEEKWHWSYLPVSIQLIKEAKADLTDEMIKGFKGSEVAPSIGVVEKYVLGISKSCL